VNFAALKQAVRDRVEIDAVRAGRLVNDARAELDDMFPWPYRKTSAKDIASAPYANIPDLGPIVAVFDTSTATPVQLRKISHEEAARRSAERGSPDSYVVTDGDTITPVAFGGILTVHYYRITPDLALATDVPAAPARFHRIIANLATERALRDVANLKDADALRGSIDRDLNQMVSALLGPSLGDAPLGVQISGLNAWSC
jgi:hypothetical protein